MNRTKIAALVVGALLICGGRAEAQISWNFGTAAGSAVLGDTISGARTGTAITATAQAWANTNNGTSYTNTSPITTPSSALGSNTLSGSNGYALETAYLYAYSGLGLGVTNQDASTSTSYGDYNDGTNPEHSTDNNQRYDSVLFNFNSAIDLNSVTIGWHNTNTSIDPSTSLPYSTDSDITVLAYTGTGTCVATNTCTSSLSGKTYGLLTSYGWSLIGQYSDVVVGADPVGGTTKSVNAGNITSSLWLIGAANPLVGGTTDATSDYVKILALGSCTPNCVGTPSSNPEPGTLFLMGAGLIGLVRTTRRRQVLAA